MRVLCVQFGSTCWDMFNLECVLSDQGFEVDSVASRNLRAPEGHYDVVLQVGLKPTPQEREGLDFLRKLRSMLPPETPILVATHHRSPEVEAWAREVPNTEYLSRKIDNGSEIVEKLHKMTAANKNAPA